MRGLAIAALLALSLVAPASAASLDPAQIAAIDKAASDFLAKATDAKKTGMVPRETDPAVAPLSDTVFDTSVLSHGPMDFADLDKLGDWLDRLNAVGLVYQNAARQAHDVGLFSAEIGRFFDAALAVLQASVDCDVANSDAHPDVKPTAKDQARLAKKRSDVAGSLGKMIGVLRVDGGMGRRPLARSVGGGAEHGTVSAAGAARATACRNVANGSRDPRQKAAADV
jgi:hypothetical protein